MNTLVVLRDNADGHVDLVKTETQYILRMWKYPVGGHITTVKEIALEMHETMELLKTLLDEVETWRRRESA